MGIIAVRKQDDGLYYVAGAGQTQTRLANRFLRSLSLRGLSPRTVRAYAFDLVSMYRWLAARAAQDVAALDNAALVEFIAAQRGSSASPRSINRRLSTIRLFYRFVTGRDLPGSTGVSLPGGHYRGTGRDKSLGLHRRRKVRHTRLRVKTPRTLVQPLSAAEVRRFIETVSRFRDLVIVYLMLMAGLRSREVLLLNRRDVSLEERRFVVQGKGGKERTLPLPMIIADTICRYLALERPDHCATERLLVVLQGPTRGKPMTAAGLRRLFRYRRMDPALRSANPHRFRHTFGADMAREGVTIPVLQRLMGHAQPDTTMQYVELNLSDVSAEFDRVSARIRSRYQK